MPKPRKCRCGCGQPIPDGNTLRIAATLECALKMAQAMRQKRERKELREAKARLKTRQQWLRDAQAAFNAYIRVRDFDLPCISCGDFTPMTRGGDYDCGHYRSIGANPELRFHEQNANKQCKQCNRHLSGNVANYRIGLLMKYGEGVVAEIEGPHPPKKYTVPELREMIAEYRAKRRELERGRL